MVSRAEIHNSRGGGATRGRVHRIPLDLGSQIMVFFASQFQPQIVSLIGSLVFLIRDILFQTHIIKGLMQKLSMRINHKHFVYIISLPELASLEKNVNKQAC